MADSVEDIDIKRGLTNAISYFMTQNGRVDSDAMRSQFQKMAGSEVIVFLNKTIVIVH